MSEATYSAIYKMSFLMVNTGFLFYTKGIARVYDWLGVVSFAIDGAKIR